jgi:hypothetical protein
MFLHPKKEHKKNIEENIYIVIYLFDSLILSIVSFHIMR